MNVIFTIWVNKVFFIRAFVRAKKSRLVYASAYKLYMIYGVYGEDV